MNKKISLVLILIAGFTAGAFAQSTATATATATIVGPISITKTGDLNFGAVAPGATGGTLVLTPAGTTSVTSDVTTQGGTLSAATFTVSGDANATYSITFPNASVSLSDGAAGTMTVDTFTSSPATTGTLDGTTGEQTLTVGGTLNVGAAQTAGTYTNTSDLQVTVGYN